MMDALTAAAVDVRPLGVELSVLLLVGGILLLLGLVVAAVGRGRRRARPQPRETTGAISRPGRSPD